MKGTHDSCGRVSIQFESQGEWLAAPPAPDGSPRKWLPCEQCGDLVAFAMNVVSGLCEPCETRTCSQCGAFHKNQTCAGACCTMQGGDCGCADPERVNCGGCGQSWNLFESDATDPDAYCSAACEGSDVEEEPNDRCSNPEGHKFVCTGTQYGGDDERWHGEGRCLCVHCGADGDA